jgi:hypothetical protein
MLRPRTSSSPLALPSPCLYLDASRHDQETKVVRVAHHGEQAGHTAADVSVFVAENASVRVIVNVGAAGASVDVDEVETNTDQSGEEDDRQEVIEWEPS